MKERAFTPRKREQGGYWTAVKSVTNFSIKFGWNNRVVRLIIIGTLVQSMFMMWGFYGWQPYLLDMLGRRDAAWISGFIAAGVAFSTAIGNGLVPLVRKIAKRRSLILAGSAVLMALASLGMGLANSFAPALIALIAMMIAAGAAMPVKQAFLHSKTPSEQRATVISFDALVGSGGGAVGQTGLGWVARQYGLSVGYMIGGIILALSAPVYLFLTRRKDEDDIIAETQHAPKA